MCCKFKLKFDATPLPTRVTIKNKTKCLEQQILFWAVREHAEDTCERKGNWKKTNTRFQTSPGINWLGLRRKRLSALSARIVKITAAFTVI